MYEIDLSSEAEAPATLYDPLLQPYEALHAPGVVQPHGVLLVARRSDLRVIYASANAGRITQIPAKDMLGVSLLDCLSAEICSKVLEYDNHKHLAFQSSRRQAVGSGVGSRHHFEVHHLNDLIYLEIELEIVAAESDRLPVQAQMVLGSMRAASSLQELFDVLTAGIRDLTGYDRVMLYQFMDDGHGYVPAESRPRGTTPYKGLHFPAHDVPAQARALYLSQSMHVIANSGYEPVPVVGHELLAAGREPLDMTYCGLRGASPTHLEYLRNMGVGATLTLSLITNDQLWGLIVCHQRAPRLPSPELRSTCELISEIASSMIHQAVDEDRRNEMKARQLAMNSIAAALEKSEALLDCLVESQENVLKIVGASGALLRFRGKSACIGITPEMEDALELMKSIRAIEAGELFASDCLGKLLPSTNIAQETVSGILVLAAQNNLRDGIVWFRPEAKETICWAGNPEHPARYNLKTGRMSPRKQFAKWKTVVEERSRSWKDVDLDAAASLNRLLTAHLLRQADGASRFEFVDALTMLPNRRSFEAALVERLERGSDSAAVLLISVNRYKLVRTALGQIVADDVMMQVARRIASVLPDDTSTLARLEGDMFAVLCVGCSVEDSMAFSDRLSEALYKPFQAFDKPFYIMASVGWAHTSQDGEEELLSSADTALHFAQKNVRHSECFNKQLQSTLVERFQLEQDLYRATEEKQFSLVYQPVVTLPAGQLVGFEALIRWNHPTRGIISPNEFIPIAEEEGLILRIGEWVLTEAVEKMGEWRRLSGRDLKINVNIAAQQVVGPGFVEMFDDLLTASGLPPEALVIEVTESALLNEAAVLKLMELRALSIGVSVDDFGTGYSSLASLRRLPVDTVKIDRSFVHPMTVDDKSGNFVAAIIQLTRTLGLEVIAEGVETQAQSEALLKMGCSRAQGYLFSVPLTEAQVLQLIDMCRRNEWCVQHLPEQALSHAA